MHTPEPDTCSVLNLPSGNGNGKRNAMNTLHILLGNHYALFACRSSTHSASSELGVGSDGARNAIKLTHFPLKKKNKDKTAL